jgi:hypothetical protein
MRRVRMMMAMTAAALIAVSSSASARREPAVGTNYGPEPDWERYKTLGEAAVRSQLIDPESARISWPYGYVKRGFTPLLSKRVYGYATCGLVNARNRMGGYTGDAVFAMVIDYDHVLYVEISKGNGYSLIGRACSQANFPAVPQITQAPKDPGTALGFTVTAMPEGAYINSVAPDSAAAEAGLMPGMVILTANNVSLAAMAAPAQVLRAIQGKISLSLVGGKTIVIDPPALPSSSMGAKP